MSKISIIIPTYNSASTIEETIASVQQQSFTDWELIIIDDGSQDNTVNVVQNIAEPRLKLFVYENGGVAVARNRGIAKAQGEFISLLDADDLWTSDKLELQLKALKDNPEAGVAYSWTNPIDEQGKILFLGSRPVCEGNVYGELLQTNFLSNGSNILSRREAIESIDGFPTDFPTASDWDFYLKLASRWSFAVVPKYQILYRQSLSSMSSHVEAVMQESCEVLEKAYKIAPVELQSSRNKSLSNLYLYFAELYLKRSKDAKSINQVGQNLWIAIRFYPQTLFNKDTQRTLVKFLLKKFLSIAI
jgi:glycosyltransferase involved in cell wall biosynthesis